MLVSSKMILLKNAIQEFTYSFFAEVETANFALFNHHFMLRRLQQKWNVSGTQFLLILIVFAITGTTTAYLSKVITSWVGFDEQTHWAARWSLRLFMLIFGYQVILLIVAFLFGQFPFFWKYEKKILGRMGLMKAKRQKNLSQKSRSRPGET